MSDTEGDDDLKRAIALSLESNALIAPSHFIDLASSDMEDDDIDAPVNIKTSTLEKATNINPEVQINPHKLDVNPHIVKSSTQSVQSETAMIATAAVSQGLLLGLNRKQMEEERLLRVRQRMSQDANRFEMVYETKKRKLAESPPRHNGNAARNVRAKELATSHIVNDGSLDQALDPSTTRIDNDVSTLSDKFQYIASPGLSMSLERETMKETVLGEIRNRHQGVLSYREQQTLGSPGIQFPTGVVKKTWAYGYPREDDIKIEEVFQKADLELAVLSAFQVEPEWVESKLNQTTKIIWVLQAKNEQEKQNIRSGAPSNYQFCFPSMDGNINCMHSKLQLLAHQSYLRICIPSANLVPYDWGETGIMENVCFLIDLPRLADGNLVELEQMTEFGKELLHYLSAIGLKESVIRSVRKFDFSRTSHLAFIHTIGGSHFGEDWQRTGYCGLGTAVRKLGLDTDQDLTIDFVAASIGNINESFLKSIYLATQGDSGQKEYAWRASKPSKSKLTTEEEKISHQLKTDFRIYFPTRETVAQSKGGIGAGGTIFLHSKWYDSKTFPQHVMRDCKSRRNGMLMHSKILFVRSSDSPSASSKAWAYVGSANCSEAAWGRLVNDKISKGPKLNCRNWECGVLISVAGQTEKAPKDIIAVEDTRRVSGMDIFQGVIPVPMIVPGAEYGKNKPWFKDEQ